MGLLKLRLSVGMLWIVLVAVDLYALNLVLDPGPLGPQPRYLVLSALPMANLGAMAGYRLAMGGRLRPFAAGFLAVGLVTLVVQVGLQASYPPIRWAYDRAARSFFDYCQCYAIPGSIAIRGDGTQFFRYAPALGLIYSSPQFVAGLLGGALVACGSWLGGRRSTAY